MQRISSFSHAWTHEVQYRAQSLLPCPFYHKSQSSEVSNHKSTDEATIILLFVDSASPSSSSRNHLTALVLLVVLPLVLFCLHLRKFRFPRNAQRIGIFPVLFPTGPSIPFHRMCACSNPISLSHVLRIFPRQRELLACRNRRESERRMRAERWTGEKETACMHAEVRRLVCMALH